MIRPMLASFLVLTLVILSVGPSCARPAGGTGPEQIHIEADTIRTILDPEAYEAEGDVILFFAGGYLKADRVFLDVQSGNARAEGSVFIQSDGDMLEGAAATFNIISRQGAVTDGTVFFEQDNLYLRGRTIERRGEHEYALHDGTITTCCGDVPDWKISGRRIDVTIDGYGTISHGFFNVKDYPIFYVPYMIVPVKTTRQSGLLQPRVSYSRDKLGWDTEIPFYWVMSESADATFYQRYMDKRGYQQGVELRYFPAEHSFGVVYADYLRDGLDITTEDGSGELFRDWREPRDRWSYYLDHQTSLDSGLSLRANIKNVSDNWYFRDFDSHNYYLRHYDETADRPFRWVDFSGDAFLSSLASTVRVTQDWNRFNLTVLGQYTDNLRQHSNDRTLQKYPEVTLTGMKQPLWDTPFDFELDSTYGYYYRGRGQRGHLLDAAPAISLPVNVGHYFRFIPEAGFRETRWDSTDTTDALPDSRDNRTLYHVGSTVTSDIQRIFAVERSGIDRVRHEVRPEVTYRYRPLVSQDTRPDYVSLIDEQNTLAYSVTNRFTARFVDDDGRHTYRELAMLKVGQVYDIAEARRDAAIPGQRRYPFSDVAVELGVTPHPYLSFSSDAVVDVYRGDWTTLNGILRLSDSRGDQAIVEYRYTRDLVKQLNLGLQVQATERLGLSFRRNYDQSAKKNLETTYGVSYSKQCWDVLFSLFDSHDDRGFMILVSLSGLGPLLPVTGTVPGRE